MPRSSGIEPDPLLAGQLRDGRPCVGGDSPLAPVHDLRVSPCTECCGNFAGAPECVDQLAVGSRWRLLVHNRQMSHRLTFLNPQLGRERQSDSVTMRGMANPPRSAQWRDQVAERLASTREALDLTQEELAEQLGVSRSALGNWETGRNLPDVAAMDRFAERHRITLDWIYRGDPSALPRNLARKLLGESTSSGEADLKQTG